MDPVTIQIIISSLGVAVPVVSSMIWIGFRITERINSLDKTLVEIRTLLQATITRIEHIEKNLEKLDIRVSHLEKTTWEEKK